MNTHSLAVLYVHMEDIRRLGGSDYYALRRVFNHSVKLWAADMIYDHDELRDEIVNRASDIIRERSIDSFLDLG